MGIDIILENLGNLITQNSWLGLIIAFVAGLLTFFTPCGLSTVPMVIAYVGGTSSTRKKAFMYSVFVALGQVVVLTIYGVVLAFIGEVFPGGIWTVIFNIVMGILMVVMAYEMWGLTNFFGKTCGANIRTTKKGILGAFLVGLTGVVFSTPCSTPVLVAITGVALTSSTGWINTVLLMLCYSVGFSLLGVVCGTSIGFVRQLQTSPKFEKAAEIIKIVLGCLIFIFGMYLIVNTLYF